MKSSPRKQRLSQMQGRVEQLEQRALLTTVDIGFGTGVHTYNVAGYNIFQDNADFPTTSSAFGMSEASMTASQMVTTSAGGLISSKLNDAYDGAMSFGLSDGQGGTTSTTYVDADGLVDITGNTLTGDFNSVGADGNSFNGLQVSQQNAVFALSGTEPIIRYLYAVTNPTDAPITQQFGIYNNWGSDNNTRIVSTSSGDNIFTDGTDRWFTSFQNYSGSTSSDPRLLTVIQGTGTVAAPVSTYGNVADGNDNPNVFYTLTINPGETKYVLAFGGLFASKAAATGAGNNVFADNSSVKAAGLLDGINPEIYPDIVNWELNIPPTFTSNAAVSVAENQTAVTTVTATDSDIPAQTLSYSVTGGVDMALFTIDPATGALAFIAAPDFETPLDVGGDNIYNVDVTVDDNNGGTTVQSLTITVTAVNDNTPSFTSSPTFSVPENTAAVGTVTATDADLPAQAVTYSISGGDDAALFTIDPTTGALAFITAPDFETPLDVGADNVYNIDVTANDNAGLTKVQSIAVTVTAVNDNSPVFTSLAAFTVAEGSSNAGTVTATDADIPAQTLSYSITGGVDAALFSVNPTTGLLSFLTPPDYEHPTDVGANNVYDVQVTANDGAGLTTAQDLTVNVTNVVEEPVITLTEETGTYHLGKDRAFLDPTAQYQAENSTNDYSSAVLTVSITANRQPKDILSIYPKGSAPGQISVKGKKVLFGGVVIGTFQGGSKSSPNLVITFNAAASEAAVQALVKRINFNAKNTRLPQPTRTLQMQITNVSGYDSNLATREINVVAKVS